MPTAPSDPRRRIPRTDDLLTLPEVAAASASLSRPVVTGIIRGVQDRARAGAITPEDVQAEVVRLVTGRTPSALRPVLNATGVIIHTNLGRAPLSAAARAAIADAAGYTDVEMDLGTGKRSRRGTQARAALLQRMPDAEDAFVVNNGAAALVLATTALAFDRDVIISRGQFVEIGAGFRLSDLMESTGARLREVGTTNRTRLEDYADAIGEGTGAILVVHPSNFRLEGFTGVPPLNDVAALAHERGVPLIVDVGSGQFEPDAALPEEPSIAEALRAGADVVLASGDKLMGGPQAGVLAGRADTVAQLSRHPLARAVRVDKLTLAALEATLLGPTPPVLAALHADPAELRRRTEALADAVHGAAPNAGVVEHEGRVGGGGGTGVPLPGWALRLPTRLADPLRSGEVPVVGRVADGACLIDLRCIPEDQDQVLAEQIIAAAAPAESTEEKGS
ncbi:L-seryl-tRNA(Sec) selenium transferase [Helcobacillus sp. ACRRO]|uniref:L-seryl-tRNA(Sec) selenium transferase n=1 Tax=Helcobacillus sp. ACRRO TaxID=2918202 RepID=UPI001EF5FEF0|nr:L-seryl-tRNA(Sec) selenium transferase [Helcobacillus sp. ACRRO]